MPRVMQSRRGSAGLFWAVVGLALSVPAALGLEALAHLLMPPQLEELRVHASPFLTPITWTFVPASVVCNIAAFFVLRWLQRRPSRSSTPARARSLGVLQNLMLSASLAQLPAILAAFAYLIGSSIRPTAITVAISTIGVMCLWLAVEADIDRGGDVHTE